MNNRSRIAAALNEASRAMDKLAGHIRELPEPTAAELVEECAQLMEVAARWLLPPGRPHFDPDYGGVYDGFAVSSDADPGL